ncbi:MAG: SPFH domain-containing protein [Paracoccaceae bacterium]|nr:SPFH domain-containing protein [Paracoccaceae bacterium]MDG2258144.1 SPFH domain-containing protein [Paracoccaceae bacterium]
MSETSKIDKSRKALVLNGVSMLLVLIAGVAVGVVSFISGGMNGSVLQILGTIALTVLLVLFVVPGFFLNQPKQARVLTLFGAYRGTDKTAGLRWTNPFYYPRMKVSTRLNNFESGRSKVNDAIGNPIEISAIVVWRVIDPVSAVFEVEDYDAYVITQTESAVRSLASKYPYDFGLHDDQDGLSLRGDTANVAEEMMQAIQERVAEAGIEIVEARINHLAYATEIAAAMLKRQQASALLDARETIVKGTVSIVESALKKLEESDGIELDPERKAAMVSNLMVVLSSGAEPTPVINAGSLY